MTFHYCAVGKSSGTFDQRQTGPAVAETSMAVPRMASPEPPEASSPPASRPVRRRSLATTRVSATPRAARGILLGLALALPLWAGLIALIRILFF